MTSMSPAPQPQLASQIVPYEPKWPLGDWGFKLMLLGDTGGGKTYSIKTLVDAGLEVFVLFTENGMATLRNTDPQKLHWHYVKPAPFDLAAAKNLADSMSKMQFQQLTQLVDSNKFKFNQFVDVLAAMSNFYCQRTKQYYGPVDKWGTDRVFVIDSLSGLSLMAMYLIIGGKPGTHEGEWGMAMGQIEKIVNAMCLALPTNFVLMSHLEREQSAIDLTPRLMASTLGKKLAPKLPRYFDEVVVTYREIDKWWWSTTYPNADCKSRVLGYKDKMPASFVPLVQALKVTPTA